MKNWIEAARIYSSWDWWLFPCEPGGKEPVKTGGNHPDGRPKRLKWRDAASPLMECIARWERLFPGANWALACGRRSGVFVIDIDLKNGNDGGLSLSFLMAAYGQLPDALS